MLLFEFNRPTRWSQDAETICDVYEENTVINDFVVWAKTILV